MSSALARLQLPLLFLPLVVVGLGVFGSDFDVLPGRIFIGLFLALPLLDATLGRRVERLASGAAGTWIALLGIPVAALAYRPVHLAYWDEHSTPQAAGFALLGVFSWGIGRLGSGLARRTGDAPRGSFAAALLLLGLAWLSAALYPLLPALALGAVFAVVAVGLAGERASASPEPSEARAKLDGVLWWGALLLGMDLFAVVWDYRWVTSWAAHLALAFAAAALGWLLARRCGGWLLGLGAANFLGAALVPSWVLAYPHAALGGLALGALLARALDGVPGRARSSWVLPWVLGLALGLGLYENLAFAGWRAVLLLPPLFLAVRAHRTPRAARP